MQTELKVAQSLLDQVREAIKQRAVRPLAETLQTEKRRAERYNHYFSLLLLHSASLDYLHLVNAVSGTLRVTDVLGVLDGNGDYHVYDRNGNSEHASAEEVPVEGARAVAVVLPETDRGGAEVALNRLQVAFTAEDGLTAGFAVYPDDSTDADQLIAIAAA